MNRDMGILPVKRRVVQVIISEERERTLFFSSINEEGMQAAVESASLPNSLYQFLAALYHEKLDFDMMIRFEVGNDCTVANISIYGTEAVHDKVDVILERLNMNVPAAQPVA